MQVEQANTIIENVRVKKEALMRNLKASGSSELEGWCAFMQGDSLPSRSIMEGLTRSLLDMTKKAEARWREMSRQIPVKGSGIACMDAPRDLLREIDTLYDRAAFLKDKLFTEALSLLFVLRMMDGSSKEGAKSRFPLPRSPLSRSPPLSPSNGEDPLPHFGPRPPFFEARGNMTLKLVSYRSNTAQISI